MSRSSFPRNISGNQQVEITNFHTAPTVIKGQTDITKPDTQIPLLCNSKGNLQVNTNNKQDILSFENASWTSGTFSDVFDCSNSSKIRLYGNIQTTDTLQLQYASSVSGGVYDWIFSNETVPITTIDGSICIDMLIDCPPPYIRIKNNSATNQSVSLRVVKH